MKPEVAARQALQHALSRPAKLGPGRLVCVDGPSGSGKTTLAEAIGALVPARVVHVDELFPGWEGMAQIGPLVQRLLTPLAQGTDGHWRRWDWNAGRYAEWHRVPPGGLLVLDGVGAGGARWSRWTTTLVWVEAPRAVRLARGLTRNDGMEENWRRWQVREDALHVAHHTRDRADLVVPTAHP